MTTAAQKKRKLEHILDKGMQLIWTNGYNATSVNDIVKAAQIPKGSFYFYFKSKEDFAVKAIERYFNDHVEKATELLMTKGISPKARLLNFYTYRVSVLKEKLNCQSGCLACNISNEMAEHSEAIRSSIREKSDTITSMIADVISEAQKNGEINSRLDAKNLAVFIEDAGKGAMISMKEMQSSYAIDNVLVVIKDILLK